MANTEVDKSRLLSISQLGKMRKVSSQTLRYYDSIGIFEPDYIDPETGYRYYDPEQYEKLGTILELRNLNFTLDEIKEYFDSRNLHKSATMLGRHYAELCRELELKRQLVEKIGEKLDFIEQITSGSVKEEEFSIKEFPERYAIVSTQTKWGDYPIAYMNLERQLEETAPILASDRIGFYIEFDNADEMERISNWQEMILCTETVKSSKNFRVIPKGKYLCVYFRNYRVDREYYLKRFNEYVKFHDIRLGGLMLQQFVIDVTMTDIPDETIIEFQALIE